MPNDDLDDDLDRRPFPTPGAGVCRVCDHAPMSGRYRETSWPPELLTCPCACHESWRLVWQLDAAVGP